ncbi:MAG: serine/threonine protein kinase [Deltaproteobacteria bacterium]|nr:serine/threonine protein kinase [Deltaproteobacteria bacterium]
MQIGNIPATATVWVKTISTNIFGKMHSKLIQIEFIRRNRKIIVIGLITWIILNAGCYLFFQEAENRRHNDFYKRGTTLTQSFASKISSSLLENDILSLNNAIINFEGINDLYYLEILDFANRVIAHSDFKKINLQYATPEDIKNIDPVKGVFIDAWKLPDNNKIIRFSTDVVYSRTKIGKVNLAFPASFLYGLSNKYRIFITIILACSTLILAVCLVMSNLIKKAKALQIQRELEDMTRIHHYTLVKKIGQGGMAEMFLAEYEREDGFRRKVALKKVLPHLSGNRYYIKMFIREARLAALLQHPNIVQITDYGNYHNAYFIVMEYINGMNLSEIMEKVKEGLPVDLSIFIGIKVSMGLQYSHSKLDDKSQEPLNIVHRDISPHNIMISYGGEVKITDFGIAKTESDPSLTQTGVIKGKLLYMSPEQVLRQKIDCRADIYAVGVVLYEILSGHHVFQFKGDIDAVQSILNAEIPQLKDIRSDIPEDLNRIVMKCLEKDKKERYQTAGEVYRDLLRLKEKLNITYDMQNLADYMEKYFKK